MKVKEELRKIQVEKTKFVGVMKNQIYKMASFAMCFIIIRETIKSYRTQMTRLSQSNLYLREQNSSIKIQFRLEVNSKVSLEAQLNDFKSSF